MRWGCCGKTSQADEIATAGFDFLEVNIQQVLQGDTPDDAWTSPDLSALPLPIEAANCLVPGSHPLIGPGRDLALLTTYMDRVAGRAKRVGIERLVFGSGGARRRPEDISPAEAMDALVEFTKIAGEACERHGVVLVIEHLNQRETNTLNSLAEAQELFERVEQPAVQMLVDSYHFGLEGESDQAILNLGSTIRHVHVAEPVDRLQPGGHGTSEKAFDFEAFFCALRKVGYDERISIEASKWSPDFGAALAPALKYLQDAWDAAGDGECSTD